MTLDPHHLPDDAVAFLTERHLASLTTLRADGTPHVVPVGFTFDSSDCTARIITIDGSQKVVNARRGGPAVLCQIDGSRWISLEGSVAVTDDPDKVRRAVESYASRYRTPAERPDRVALEIRVTRILGRFA